MDYLLELLEIEKRLRRWEIGTASIASYVLSDNERKGRWLEEGKGIERVVFESRLDQDDKERMFGRINSSYNLVSKPATDNAISKYSPYVLGFLAGLYFAGLASNFSKKIEGELADKIATALEKEIGERFARSSNS
jgi:hypothetical protein